MIKLKYENSNFYRVYIVVNSTIANKNNNLNRIERTDRSAEKTITKKEINFNKIDRIDRMDRNPESN